MRKAVLVAVVAAIAGSSAAPAQAHPAWEHYQQKVLHKHLEVLDEVSVLENLDTVLETARERWERLDREWRAAHPVVPEVSGPVGGDAVSSAPSSQGDIFWQLALCESGGTNANTGNGYYGYFQFLPSTWQSLGYAGLPTDYSYATQREGAAALQARSGWGQWPACAASLGLL